MAKKISSLSIHLTMDSRGVVKGAKVAAGGLDRLEKEAKQSQAAMDRMDKRMKSMQRTMSGFGRAVIGFVSIRSVIGDVNNQLERMSRLVDQASSLGVRTDELTRYTHALERVGVEASQVEASLGRFRRRLGEASAFSGGPAAKALEEIGLEASELTDGFEGLLTVIDAIGETYDDTASRMSVATKFFGDDARSFVNAINQGRAAIEEYATEADKLGVTVEQETAQEMKDAKDTIDNFHKSLEGGRLRLYADGIKIISGNADEASTKMQNLTGGILEFAEALIPSTGAFAGLRDLIGEARADQDRRIAASFDIVKPVPRAERMRALKEREDAAKEAESMETAVAAANELIVGARDLWGRATEEARHRFTVGWIDLTNTIESAGGELVESMATLKKEAEDPTAAGTLGAADARTAAARSQAARDRLEVESVALLREIRDESKKPSVEVSPYSEPGVPV